MAILLFGYDVESGDPTVTRAFLKRAEAIHTRWQAPTTLFLVGRTLEQNCDALRALQQNPYFEFQSHTYSHKLLKTVCAFDGKATTVTHGMPFCEIDYEVARANDVLKAELGVTALGLTGPWCYYRGLSDRPDILAILHRHGIRYLRTYGRNEHDWQPVPLDLQPFWYAPQGYPDILECCVHGWQDCIRRDEVGWENTGAYLTLIQKDLDYAAEHDLVFSYCQHDWSSLRGDPEMRIVEGVLRHARELGMQIMSYTEFYNSQQL